MSYFEYFSKNISTSQPPAEIKNSASVQDVIPIPTQKTKKKNKTSKEFSSTTYKDTESIIGTCLSMCPADEVIMREKARMVHVLEVIDGKKMLVKCYSRSAADSLVAVPRLLRPYKVLRDTVHHLLMRIAQREDTNTAVIYDFVSDRLRAVRQDMTIQRLSPEQCVTLLEPMVRFHVYFGYKLCEYPIKAYDPVLNKKLLLECLKWFLSCCDSMDQPRDLDTELSQLNLNSDVTSNKDEIRRVLNGDKETKWDRALMESLYIICNLDDVHPMYRYLNLPKNLKSHATIRLAYKIAADNWRLNYVLVCKQIEHLCPLTYCALCLYLPTLQRHALQVLSAAYNSKQLTVPLSAVRRWLHFSSDAEAARACAYYGLPAKEGAVRFTRANFKIDIPTHQPTKLLHRDQKIDLSSEHVFTYLSQDYTYGV